MTLKIKAPPMPEPLWTGDLGCCYTKRQMDVREAQWRELVGPVVEALKQSLDECIYPSAVISDVYEKARAALRAITEEQE